MKFYQRIAAFLAAAMLAVATCAIPAHADTADDLAAAQARLEELGAQLNSLQTTLAEQGAQLIVQALEGVERIRKGREFLIYPMPPYSAFADIGLTPNPAFEGY